MRGEAVGFILYVAAITVDLAVGLARWCRSIRPVGFSRIKVAVPHNVTTVRCLAAVKSISPIFK
jgi:hypothetical protein